jgi:2,5-furandicarboxylate decarboxylase 1
MARNLNMRDWIRTLDEAGELVRVKKPVDPVESMGALLYGSRERALLFENIAGFPNWTALGQAPANVRQAALALGVPLHDLIPEFSRRSKTLLKPVLVQDGPVREVIQEGDQVDVTTFPAHMCGEKDGGRFISSGLVVSKDPDTGIRNLSFHRMQIKDKRKLGILIYPRHMSLIYRKYEDRNEPMPVSIMIGHHPCYYLAAAYTGDFELDELELAGALLQEPVELVKASHADLEVPAHAEISLEGFILPHVREPEGPFSEFQDYYVAGMGHNPVLRIDRITMRHDAMYYTIQNGSEMGGCVYHKVPMSAAIYDRLKNVGGFVDLQNVMITPGIFGIVIQIRQRFRGEAKNILLGALSTQYQHPKVAIVVDEDVDLNSPADVLWALNTRVDPVNDVFLIPNARVHAMDPTGVEVVPPGSTIWNRVGSKMGIDATKPSIAEPRERDVFERIKPKNLEQIRLEDFL